MDPPGPGPGSKPRPEPAPSSVSLKSDRSNDCPPQFREAPPGDQSTYNMVSPGSGPGSKLSSLSLKSDRSNDCPPQFTEAPPEDQRSKPRPKPDPSFLSLKSDRSNDCPPEFREAPPEDQREPDQQEQLDTIFMRLEGDILTFVKEHLQRLHRLLVSESTSESSSESEEDQHSRDAVLTITLDFLKRMKQEHLAEHLSSRSSVGVCRDKLKKRLEKRFSCVFEGVAKAGNSAPLNEIYIDLHITEGGASEVNQEHEVRYIETMSRNPDTLETSITCEDLFKSPDITEEEPVTAELTEEGSIRTENMKRKMQITTDLTKRKKIKKNRKNNETNQKEERPIRTVLTKGVAGIGKTVLTQKLSLDWAEGKANRDIQLLFPFSFRELNVLKDRSFSLVELLHHCFSEVKELHRFEDLQVLFIFDGLDECRLPLDFHRTQVLTDPTESALVGELLVNLIRGNLLPSARLLITTRPAATNQIPEECISMVTEVRGFTEPQKEQYFIKRFREEATAVISHIKSIRSLYIMCYIPIFCWILSTVMLHLMRTNQRGNLPHTLTQMYIYFLVIQAKVKNIKYHGGSGTEPHWTLETKKMVWSLGKLALEQLQKGNLIFYESDLRECGLDAAEIALYSGVFTEIFREESGLYQGKVYCFIHLTVQEFLAALHLHENFFSSFKDLLSPLISSETWGHTSSTMAFSQISKTFYYRTAVDGALQSPNGHLDMVLRFLLGLSLPTNQRLLSGLLTERESDQTNQEIVMYIHEKLNEEGLSVERSLNLLHCLNELNDCGLVEQIQRQMRGGRVTFNSPAQWSALSFVLLSSDSDLEEFDLRKYQASETALMKLLPVVKVSTKANLSACHLTSRSCGALASVLSSSSLTILDLSNNDLQDSGVKLLCEGLKSAPYRLHTLMLSGCLVSERGGACLASALRSTPFVLRKLDLSYNDLGASAELLTALQETHSALDSLRLDPSGEQWMFPGLRKYSCEISLDPNTVQGNLLLSQNKRTVARIRQKPPHPFQGYPIVRQGVIEDLCMSWAEVRSSTGLSGRCFWEVEWSSKRRAAVIDIAVSYRGDRERGHRGQSGFGGNDQSWSLRIKEGKYSVCHNKTETVLSYTPSSLPLLTHSNLFLRPSSDYIISNSPSPSSSPSPSLIPTAYLTSRFSPSSDHTASGVVGVFLDTEAGALSFYEVDSGRNLFHLHTFFSSFTEPLFPGFGLRAEKSSVSVVDVKR